MHPVLYLQANGPIAEDDQALEQGLSETCTGCFLVHDDRSELLVIADEDDLLAAEDERDHTLCSVASQTRENAGWPDAYLVRPLA